VERCVLLVRHRADLQEIQVEVDVPPDLPEVECDAGQVQQVLVALCMNAIEAMPEGGTLCIAARAADGELLLSVSDTGLGIAAEHLEHVFEPFFTTKEEGVGVGLGLAVVYGVATRHGGRVQIESRTGEGTKVLVRFPLRQDPRVPAASRPLTEVLP